MSYINAPDESENETDFYADTMITGKDKTTEFKLLKSVEDEDYNVYNAPPVPTDEEMDQQRKEKTKCVIILMVTILCLILSGVAGFLIYTFLFENEHPITEAPKIIDTGLPTESPTELPTFIPTILPTISPTGAPIASPTAYPTYLPSLYPTFDPTIEPTVDPTIYPTFDPTSDPTLDPTDFPTSNPTRIPTIHPTTFPTRDPTTNPTRDPTTNPTRDPTRDPTINPTLSPTNVPTNVPTKSPSIRPTFSPTRIPTNNPTIQPTINPSELPSINPTRDPTRDPTKNPTHDPTNNPTIQPTINPSVLPSINPTRDPTRDPTKNPTHDPTNNPTIDPTRDPTFIPTLIPSVHPTEYPTTDPTQIPTGFPTSDPTDFPTSHPTTHPTEMPTNDPTMMPTNNPSTNPTIQPTLIPTTEPTYEPTASPTTRIQFIGNTIHDSGITMTFPPKAFPDSILTIIIGEPDENFKSIYDESTSPFKAYPLDDIQNNYILFHVEHMPLDTPNITYTTSIPIPNDLLELCPNDYGYEIFSFMNQYGFDNDSYVTFELSESLYDINEDKHTLTTELVPEIFNNFTAQLLISCTPGTNIPASPGRRLLYEHKRQLLQSTDLDKCKAAHIQCPIQNKGCTGFIGKSFNVNHTGVDYKASFKNITAPASGIVEKSGISSIYDERIILRHLDGSATLYGDLSSRLVSEGEEVNEGDIIGVTGRTHLHFEYIPNGKLNPWKGRIDGSLCIPYYDPIITTTEEPAIHEGSITVRDSGRLADDSFAVYIDTFYLCETEIGELNNCAISNLRPGMHVLTLEVLVAPDNYGTYMVELHDGLRFADNTTVKNNIDGVDIIQPPPGYRISWDFTVPFQNDRSALSNP